MKKENINFAQVHPQAVQEEKVCVFLRICSLVVWEISLSYILNKKLV